MLACDALVTPTEAALLWLPMVGAHLAEPRAAALAVRTCVSVGSVH